MTQLSQLFQIYTTKQSIVQKMSLEKKKKKSPAIEKSNEVNVQDLLDQKDHKEVDLLFQDT